jgi:cellulose synthase/poly-beta-1,6-N-acetylglucosamine synthase-like glycosyltransferase
VSFDPAAWYEVESRNSFFALRDFLGDQISIAVTVRNEVSSVGELMESLLSQTDPPSEIVVADGGSEDGTADQIEEIAHRANVPIRVIRGGPLNIAGGRNLAIAEASGPIVAVTDAGTKPRANWLAELTAPFREDDVAVSSGFFEPGGRTLFQRILARVITPQLQEIDPRSFLPSSRSIAFRKAWWSRAGKYPEWLDHCEDLVFDMELRDAGAKFAFTPSAVVDWDARPTIRAFAQQYFLYGRGDGHAGLWPGRHAIRYASYVLGASLVAVAVATSSLIPLVIVAGLAAVYLSKFYRRVWRIRPSGTAAGLVAAWLLIPVIVITGDLAKMTGYLTGRLGRPRPVPARAAGSVDAATRR